MARAGRMFSSGRLAGPVTLSHAKRRTNVRKASVTSVDSLYSTDSEDQVLVINKGLDRCATLLQDILQSEGTENTNHNLSCRGIAWQPPLKGRGIAWQPPLKGRGIAWQPPLKGRGIAWQPPLKGRGSAWQPPLKGRGSAGRKTSSVCHAHKDSASLRKSGPSVVRGKRVNAPQRLVRPHSPVSQPALCEHVQTQMSRLTTDQGPDCAPLYNGRLPTSTPALSPGDGSRAQNEGHEASSQVLPQGGAAHLSPGTVAPIVYVPTSGQYHSAMPTAPQQPCQTDNVPHLIANDKCVWERDFLQHVATRLAQLQVSGDVVQTLRKAERCVRETDEASSGEEEEDQARTVSCQTSFERNPRAKASSTEKIRTVSYLLGEIKALVSDHDDREVMRLISELERSVSLLPAVVGNTQFHAELALTLQPLRSENAQLRRRLRILNQQLRDRERQDRGERVDACNAEAISFQTLNETLQKQLDESRKDIQSLQSKTQELLRVMEAQQEENQKLARTVQDKDQELRLILWQQESTETRTKTDLGECLVKMKMNLESCEKENKVLEVTLRQREGEVSRLRELTRTLQASMAKLLCDLGREHGKSSTGPNLTRALLDSYEKQLREENIPASASIIRYLKQVKTEQALPGQNPDCPSVSNTVTSTGTGRCLTPEDHTEPGHSQPNHLLPSSRRRPGSRSAALTESCLSTCDEYKPDETTYLPLTSSPHRAQLVPSQRHMCTPPMADMGARVCETGAANRMCCSVGDREDSQNGGEFDFKKTLQPSPNKTHRRTKPEGGNPREPGLARCPLTQPTTSPEDKGHNLAMSDFTSGKPDWTIASFSTFTSHDEQDFRNGLAALDANIAKLHHTLQAGMLRK